MSTFAAMSEEHLEDTPLISIVMACRDTEPYIRKCLDSILNQTYRNWELLAVNDHSVDRTAEILNDYAQRDSRVKWFHSEGDKLIPALQTGIKQAKGLLINRMDSDDYMPKDKLESMWKVYQNYGKGYVVAGGTEHFVEEGEVGDGFLRYEQWLNNVARNNLHYQEIYRECVIPSHCWLIHRDDFLKVGAFDPLVYPEDYDLCFRFYREGLKVVGMDKVLHYWRDRGDRISRTWDCYQDNRYLELKIRYFQELDRDPERPLVLWGAGRNGKDMAKILLYSDMKFHWVCDNPRKVGKDIYGIKLEALEAIPDIEHPQIMVVVSSPDARTIITDQLSQWGKKPVADYWFFL